jgi:hypothetical protein
VRLLFEGAGGRLRSSACVFEATARLLLGLGARLRPRIERLGGAQCEQERGEPARLGRREAASLQALRAATLPQRLESGALLGGEVQGAEQWGAAVLELDQARPDRGEEREHQRLGGRGLERHRDRALGDQRHRARPGRERLLLELPGAVLQGRERAQVFHQLHAQPLGEAALVDGPGLEQHLGEWAPLLELRQRAVEGLEVDEAVLHQDLPQRSVADRDLGKAGRTVAQEEAARTLAGLDGQKSGGRAPPRRKQQGGQRQFVQSPTGQLELTWIAHGRESLPAVKELGKKRGPHRLQRPGPTS